MPISNKGCLYYFEIQDYEKAIEWYIKSANQGYAWAQYNLGIFVVFLPSFFCVVKILFCIVLLIGSAFCNGRGVQQDYNKGMELLLKASKKGCLMANYKIGIAYHTCI